jgi:hypothetical protein
MIILGYRGSPDWSVVKLAFKQHTTMTFQEITKVVSSIKSGKVVTIENDFVLHDELKDIGFILK